MSSFSALPAENRVDLKGRRICRWCSTRLETSTYVSLKSKKRAEQLSCPTCDAGRISWQEEFGREGETDGA